MAAPTPRKYASASVETQRADEYRRTCTNTHVQIQLVTWIRNVTVGAADLVLVGPADQIKLETLFRLGAETAGRVTGAARDTNTG